MKERLVLDSPPKVVLIMNDYSVMGLLRAAKEGELKVPEEISIVNIANVPYYCASGSAKKPNVLIGVGL